MLAAIGLIRKFDSEVFRDLLLNANARLDRIRILITSGIHLGHTAIVLPWSGGQAERTNISFSEHLERQLAELYSSLPDVRSALRRRVRDQRRAEIQLVADVALEANACEDLRRDRCMERSAAAANDRLAVLENIPRETEPGRNVVVRTERFRFAVILITNSE